ncbi:MAG: N-acetylmuramoyl-L-alanine amidase [bacterium]
MSSRNKVNLKITEEGKKFIRGICDENASLLSGNFNIPLPFSYPPVPKSKIWECNIKDPLSNNPNKLIENNSELAEALIFWFEKYADEFQLDANILAAQAYVESGFKMWAYAKSLNSTASGVNQFLMSTTYDVIVLNLRKNKTSQDQEDIDKIIKDLRNPYNEASYKVGGENNGDARRNRPILHQNIINNPDVMIRAQFKYMKLISDRCNSIASTSLFAYNRGAYGYSAKTYTDAINKAKRKGNGYEREGINYVLKTFIVLGDKTNKINQNYGSSGSRPKPNPKGDNLFYFGYDNLFSSEDVYKPNPNFEPFLANVSESQESDSDITEYESDSVTQDLSNQTDIPYRFIFFPEKDYNREPRIENKLQIVLHHTVSGDNVAGDVGWWQQKGEKIATAFIVSRAGFIYQLFMTDYWAFHIGSKHENNNFLQRNSIGIELSNWGGLLQANNGLWYPARTDGDTQKQVPNLKAKPITNIIRYDDKYGDVGGYHGFLAFEKYTQKQINATKLIIETIAKKHNKIDLEYKGDNMWGVIENDKWVADPRALATESGVWSHTSFRPDKSDAHPQPELIQMLQNLSRSA